MSEFANDLTIVIYGRHTSYNVQKVLWLLDEMRLPYKHIELGSNPDDTETDEFGKLNPMRKVPVLIEDDKVIWESNTILRYLSNQYGVSDWVVDDAYQRSLAERWMDWSQTVFEPAFVGVFWGYYRTPEEQRDRIQIQKSIAKCEECLLQIDAQLGKHQYLSGKNISLADICAGVFIYRLVEIDLNIQLPKNVKRWYEDLKALEGYKRWVMSDFSSLKGRLQY